MASSVSLRAELQAEDLLLLMRWMANDHVYRYLNEHQQIAAQLKQVYDARLPLLTPLFNQNGPFRMICDEGGAPIGFLRMAHCPGNGAEVVLAIGEERLWSQGYGRSSLAEALKIAFFELRKDRVIAHIHCENSRSQRLFSSRGFVPCAQLGHATRYQLTMTDCQRRAAAQAREIA